MTPAIRVESLSKVYRVHHESGKKRGYRTFREDLVDMLRKRAAGVANVLRRKSGADGGAESQDEEFWALRDVSFDIQPGEVVGVIGRNGAGKSTLLKILSRITPPSFGRITINGRIGSLLEVGTGFHPELTGRENIFLNGSILGMKRSEISRMFDEIVDFSGVARFLDTPVKRYSSGMQVRLAFAVAAHLEPEILLVDEVLAVGDAEFQRRCLGKMGEVASSGRTIIFVSHNMAAITALCNKGIVINRGSIVFSGSQQEAADWYLRQAVGDASRGQYAAETTEGKSAASIVSARVESGGAFRPEGYPIGAPLEFRIQCHARKAMGAPALGIGIDNGNGERVTTLHSWHGGDPLALGVVQGPFGFHCRIEALGLAPGDYRVKFSLESDSGAVQVIEDALVFTVIPSDYLGNGGYPLRGMLLAKQSWSPSE